MQCNCKSLLTIGTPPHLYVLVFLIPPPHAVLISSEDDIRRSTSSRRLSSVSEFCVVVGPKKVSNVGQNEDGE
jgi:hypothetical protein